MNLLLLLQLEVRFAKCVLTDGIKLMMIFLYSMVGIIKLFKWLVTANPEIYSSSLSIGADA